MGSGLSESHILLGHEADRSGGEIEDSFFWYSWSSGKVINLAEKHEVEFKRVLCGDFVYQYRPFPAP